MAETGVITPGVVEYTIHGKGTKFKDEQRVFYQSELTLDGEVAILGLVSRTMVVLADAGFPLSKMADLQNEDGTLNVSVAGTLIAEAAPVVPNVVAESTAILFGYLPTDEFGRRDPAYDEVVSFLRASMTVTRWLDVVNLFTDQNDWKRMSAPFAGAMRKGVELGIWAERLKEGTSPTT